MKFSFNILRPLIFVFCGLGYLPLQSADQDLSKEFSSKDDLKIEKKLSKNKLKKSREIEKILN